MGHCSRWRCGRGLPLLCNTNSSSEWPPLASFCGGNKSFRWEDIVVVAGMKETGKSCPGACGVV